MLASGSSITLNRSGTLVQGNLDLIEREFRYLVELPSGATEIIKPSEFRQRTGMTN